MTTFQVANVRTGIAPVAPARHASGGVSVPVIRGVGAVRALYAFVPFVLLMAGSGVGTGVAGGALLAVGIVTLLQGLAVMGFAPRLVRSDAGVLAVVLADSIAIVAGVVLILGAWDQFTATAATVVLGAVVFAALSAVVVALATGVNASRSSRD
ncbi:hypothetical protein ACFXK0_13095 [Nocardia sp. NPDC059177]|uniref:hypothetical protein n=1 Tax=Nocardia sp. NPDC059177 TaxID=3346759 RepID=UPI0036A04483